MAAVSVKIKGIDEAELSIKEKFLKVKRNRQMLNEIGVMATERMKLQARKGKPLFGDNEVPGSFPPGYPASSTIRGRKYLEQFNPTHSTYKANRGNLTFTGQLIDALTYEIKDGLIRYFIADSMRKPYRISPNKFAKKTPTNEELYLLLIDKHPWFAFVGIDLKIRKRANNIVRQFLRRALKF